MNNEQIFVKLNYEWFAKDAYNILLKLGYDISKMIDYQDNINILDVACGPGGNCSMSILNRFKKNNINLTAIDYNPQSIISLTRHVEGLLKSEWFETKKIQSKLFIKLMDVENLNEYETGKFDYVTGVGALSNFYNPLLALEKIGRVLKDNGLLILGDFLVPKEAHPFTKKLTKDKYNKERPYIDYHDVFSYLEQAGFECLYYRPVRWLYDISRYPKFSIIPDDIAKNYLEVQKRADGKDVMVYNSFILRAQKKGGKESKEVFNFKSFNGFDSYENIKVFGITNECIKDIRVLYKDVFTGQVNTKIQESNDCEHNIPLNSDIVAINFMSDLVPPDERPGFFSDIAAKLEDNGFLILFDSLIRSPKGNCDYHDLMRLLHEANFSIIFYRPVTSLEDSKKDGIVELSKSFFLLVAQKIKAKDKKYDIYKQPEFTESDFTEFYEKGKFYDKIKDIAIIPNNPDLLQIFNACLLNASVSENLLKGHDEKDLPSRIKYWKGRVAQINDEQMKSKDGIHARKMLNRFLMEYLFTNETPKLAVCDEPVWEVWD